jgi:spore germination cell wall hydrolase CwlJ-like protein
MKLNHQRMLATLPVLLSAASCVPPATSWGELAPVAGSVRLAAADTENSVEAPAVLASSLSRLAPAEEEKWHKAAGLFEAPTAAPAMPFKASSDEGNRSRSLDCLTAAIYYEARSETDDGQRAVAQVVLNRVRHPAFPASVCGVVYQGSYRRTGCQFTFTCDGSLRRRPIAHIWDRARRIAEAALSGEVYAPVGNATHYHTTAILPYWASSLTRSAVVGAHIFYRWKGGAGERSAFRQDYAGNEPGAGAPRTASEADFGTPVATLSGARSVLRVERQQVYGATVSIHRGAGVTVHRASEDTPEPVAAAVEVAADDSFGIRVHKGAAPAS